MVNDNQHQDQISATNFISMLLQVQQDAVAEIEKGEKTYDELKISLLGAKSELTKLTHQIRSVPQQDRQRVGMVVNEVKQSIEHALQKASKASVASKASEEMLDVTAPGKLPPIGHLHIVTQAINEITDIFARIDFTRVRHPEIDWDWYPFESLNMPPNHPARDEWETFFIEFPSKRPVIPTKPEGRVEGSLANASSNPPAGGLRDSSTPLRSTRNDTKWNKIVLTPHTSNGQVREMEKGKLPIRMINIAKCYRRQVDVSHTPMFHQFEGMYIDHHVSIMHLKGVFDYFVKHFYGPDREIRLRPFHFQFTEPSFEVDITCDICHGTGYVTRGVKCRLCKEGWLEMAGSGMVHPAVLKNGGVDPTKYSGFAFGWGIERAYMMKSGTKLDDLRLIYSNDVRFLEQF